MRVLAGAAALWLGLTVVAPADDRLIDAHDAEIITEAMQSMGYRAKLSKDNSGDPMIESKISRSNYFIFFYGCKSQKGCNSITLKTSYNLKTKPFDMTKINGWNAKRRFGSAYLDSDGDPCMQLSVNMYGGVTRSNLEDTLDYWQTSVAEFEKLIDW